MCRTCLSFGCFDRTANLCPGHKDLADRRHREPPRDDPKDDPPRAGPSRTPGPTVRKRNIPVAIDRRRQNAAEKRRTSERRRLIDPTTCERDYNDDETAFMKAMERYKRENRRPFPTWSEVLEVLVSLGYRKVEPGRRPARHQARRAAQGLSRVSSFKFQVESAELET